MTNDATIAAALGSLAGHDTATTSPFGSCQTSRVYMRSAATNQRGRLGLTPAFEDQPLYVGKAERTLHGRDVRTHFAAGKTGSSTVRRTLAALLAGELALGPIPRNIAKPEGESLDTIETAVVRQLRPPLNLDKVGEPRARLRAARNCLADMARSWQPSAATHHVDRLMSAPPS
ncbi:MAG: hypothetical protein L0H25_05130 [Micrococcales bacterium]|nr:hypothetical protein [Micrococcales bacterium]